MVKSQSLQDENYPEVFMQISHENRPVEDVVMTLESELGTTFEETQQPIQSYSSTIFAGYEYNDRFDRYYVFSDEQEGAYVVHQQLFNMAEEGHGVRLDEMLKDFHIIH